MDKLIPEDENQNKTSSSIVDTYTAQARTVDESIQSALDLVKKYAEDNETNKEVWKNPELIYKQLDDARNNIIKAWDILDNTIKQIQYNQEENEEAVVIQDSIKNTTKDEVLRVAYVDMITDAFADVLEDIRQQHKKQNSSNNNNDNNNNTDDDDDMKNIDVLVDCLQSGLDLITNHTKFSLECSDTDWTNNNNASTTDMMTDVDEDDDNILSTPHDRRRKQLGFQLEGATT